MKNTNVTETINNDTTNIYDINVTDPINNDTTNISVTNTTNINDIDTNVTEFAVNLESNNVVI